MWIKGYARRLHEACPLRIVRTYPQRTHEMDPRDYLLAYIDREGGIPQVAMKLGMAYPTLAAICNGHRGISPKMAERMQRADPILDRNRLVWIRATKAEKKAA